MRIDEIILLEDFEDTIDSWISAHRMDIRNITRFPEHKNFQSATNNEVYRVWALSERRVTSLLKGNTLQLKAKRNSISYSWSRKGARVVEMGDSFNKGYPIYVKKTLIPNTIIFNIYEYLIKVHGPSDDPRFSQAEQEVILFPHEEYLTIRIDDILNKEEMQKEVGLPNRMVAWSNENR